MKYLAVIVPLVLPLLGCSHNKPPTELNPTHNAREESAVIMIMKAMTPSELAIELDPDKKTDIAVAIALMDEIKEKFENAGDVITACLETPRLGNFRYIVFEAEAGEKKLDINKDLRSYKGPVKGEYRRKVGDDTIAVDWYSVGQVDIGIAPDDDSHYVVRVRPKQ